MYESLLFIENKLRRILLYFVFLAKNFLYETALLKTKATVHRWVRVFFKGGSTNFPKNEFSP